VTAVVGTLRVKASKRRFLEKRGWRVGRVMSIPAIAVVLGLLVLPLGEAAYYSMTNWNGVTARWEGPETYVELFKNPTFLEVLRNNGLLLISVPFAVLIPLFIAALLNEHVFGWRVFRSVIFLPTAISWVVIGIIAVDIFAAHGPLESVIHAFGLSLFSGGALGQPGSALFAVGVTFMFSMVGTNTIIMLTGMASIDPAVFEAAKVDGAGRLRVFVSITIPLMRRFIQVSFIVTIIFAFTALFSLIFVMTGGGPDYGTTILVFYVYLEAFNVGAFGTGATVGIVLFIMMLIVAGLELLLFGVRREG